MSSDRLMSRSFWIFYLGLTIELHETLTSCFWNGMEDLARTPPFVRLNHLIHRESSAEHADGIENMLGALGELGAGLMSLIDSILKIIIHGLSPSSRSQSPSFTSGRSKIDHLVETKTTNSAIIRATQNAISTFVRAELFSDLLSTNREDVGLIDSEAERLKSGLVFSKATSLCVLNQLTSLSDRREDGNEIRHEGEEERIGLVLRTIIDYALGAGAEKAREIVGTIIGRLIPDPPFSSLSSTVSTSNSSSIGWGAWDRILYDNSIHMSFLILILTSTSPSIQPFFNKIRLFPSLSTKSFDLSSPSLSPSVLQTNDDDVGVELVGKASSTSILEWMFASPTSSLDTAIGSISQTTSIITSNPLDGPISSIVPLAPTMTTTSTMTATAVPTPVGTMAAATVGGMLSVPIQRTSKTYRQNEFRSSRSSTLTLPPGAPLTVSPDPSGTVLGGSIGPGGGLGVGMIGSGGVVQKVNASRAPSKHVDEFELEIELESQRKRESGESRKMN
ncbi:hypothetical protein [Phaffia rhodozyma]|uniref:Uncharacterized protein n=1 Tax=Phaffia rhodozyma TaxID=264483 RepID=A0A0F7SPB1_PHARH|nr:hypothetical protein [Phaffia rhodozyma]